MVVNGFSADYATSETGVPRGSVLGPWLSLIYQCALGVTGSN